jgi:hypothetical protein
VINQVRTRIDRNRGRPIDARAIETPLNEYDLSKFKDTDTGRDTSTVSDDPDLSGFILNPGSYVLIDGFLKVNSGATSAPDIVLNLQTSQTFQESFWSIVNINDAGTVTQDASDTTTLVSYAIVANQVHGLRISGYIVSNASEVSIIDLRWAQNNDNATETVIERGSWLRFVPLR